MRIWVRYIVACIVIGIHAARCGNFASAELQCATQQFRSICRKLKHPRFVAIDSLVTKFVNATPLSQFQYKKLLLILMRYRPLSRELQNTLLSKITEPYDVVHNVRDGNGNTVLHLTQDPELCKQLIARGHSLTALNNRGETPLHTALRKRAWDIALLVLDVNTLSSVDDQGQTPLHILMQKQKMHQAQTDDFSEKNKVVERMYDLMQQHTTRRGVQASLASHVWSRGQHGGMSSRTDHCMWLRDGKGETPLTCALRNAQEDMLAAVYDTKMIDDEMLYSQNVLHAVCESLPERAASLLNGLRSRKVCFSRLMQSNDEHKTPLHIFAQSCLKSGNKRKFASNQALLLAILSWAEDESREILLEPDAQGNTPLHILLLTYCRRCGVPIESEKIDGTPILDSTARMGRLSLLSKMFGLLVESSEHFDMSNKNGTTPAQIIDAILDHKHISPNMDLLHYRETIEQE